jgi:hypothetical protein
MERGMRLPFVLGDGWRQIHNLVWTRDPAVKTMKSGFQHFEYHLQNGQWTG